MLRSYPLQSETICVLNCTAYLTQMHIKYAVDRTLCPVDLLYALSKAYPFSARCKLNKRRNTRRSTQAIGSLRSWIEIYYMMDNQSSDYPYNYDRLLAELLLLCCSTFWLYLRSSTAARPQNVINRRQEEFLTDSYSFIAAHKRANKCVRYWLALARPFFSHWRQHYWRMIGRVGSGRETGDGGHMRLICRMMR